MPDSRFLSRSSEDYNVLTGDYASAYDNGVRWESKPLVAGTPLAMPTPVFTKLDPSIADEELARLAGEA